MAAALTERKVVGRSGRGLGYKHSPSVFVVYVLGLVEPADSYTDDAAQAAWGLLIWASAVASFVVGVVAIARRHERSVLVMAAVLLGLLPVVLLVSEIALGKF